jgi:hypothetical protein
MDSGLKLWGILSASAIVLLDDSPTLVKAAARLAKVVFGDRIQICDSVDDEVEIQAANDNADGGLVRVIGNTANISDLTIDNCKLDAPGAIFNVTGGIQVDPGGSIGHLEVHVATGYVGTAVTIGGDNKIISGVTDLIEYLRIVAVDKDKGKGLLIQGIGTTGHGYVSASSFGNIYIYGFEYAMHLYATEAGAFNGFVNGNYFASIHIAHSKYMLRMEKAGTAQVAGNTFGLVGLQPDGTVATDGVVLVGSIENKFECLWGWDWAVALGDTFKADVDSYDNHVLGGRIDDIADSGYRNEIYRPDELKDIEVVIPTNAGWTTYVVGSGVCSFLPTYILLNCGITANSEIRARADIAGLNIDTGWLINWNKPIRFRFSYIREVSEAEVIARVQIKDVFTEGILAAPGIGMQVDNYDISFESYGAARAVTASGVSCVSGKSKDILIAYYPGNRVEFYINGVLVATHTGNTIPIAGGGAGSGMLIHSIKNGATGGVASYSYICSPRVWRRTY